jgi:hypothetical protein
VVAEADGFNVADGQETQESHFGIEEAEASFGKQDGGLELYAIGVDDDSTRAEERFYLSEVVLHGAEEGLLVEVDGVDFGVVGDVDADAPLFLVYCVRFMEGEAVVLFNDLGEVLLVGQ